MICNKDYRYFDIAKQVASFSDFPRVKIGAACIYKNKIISVGWNQTKTSPIQEKYNRYRNFDLSQGKPPKHSLHAEMHAIIQIMDLDIDFSKVKLYVYRKRNDIPSGLAAPCNACMQIIKDVGIKNIYFTTNAGYLHEVI